MAEAASRQRQKWKAIQEHAGDKACRMAVIKPHE